MPAFPPASRRRRPAVIVDRNPRKPGSAADTVNSPSGACLRAGARALRTGCVAPGGITLPSLGRPPRNRRDVARVRLFPGEGRENRFLASRVSLAARLPRGGPGSGGPRPARCESVPVIAGTPSHRAGYGGGGAARNRAANGTAEADANDEAPGNRLPGRVLIRQRSLEKPHPCGKVPAGTGTASHRAGRGTGHPGRRPGPGRNEMPQTGHLPYVGGLVRATPQARLSRDAPAGTSSVPEYKTGLETGRHARM